MSGSCSAHMGHDPSCRICAASPPEEIARATAYYDAYTHGVRRGAEAVCEWLEGAQWDADGQPMERDFLTDGELEIFDDEAKMLAGLIRKRFCNTV